jgi:hypothetical protein
MPEVKEAPEPEINWGYNCLTGGVHHGRPEELWKIPLIQASVIFTRDDLKEIVVNRIYTDALIYVHRSPFAQKGSEETVKFTQEWAEKIKEIAEARYSDVFQNKIDELHAYYASSSWHRDVEGVIERVKSNRLNPTFQPLHGHDSINLLCRILGVSASLEVSKDTA